MEEQKERDKGDPMKITITLNEKEQEKYMKSIINIMETIAKILMAQALNIPITPEEQKQ